MLHKVDNVVSLNSGRKIGYSEHGAAQGNALIVFPGIPGSRYFQFCSEDILKRYNLTVFTLDRPGYGLSTIQEDRTILDWANDILQFMDVLSIDRANLIGYSGGAPYTLACAYAISKRFDSITCVAGADPWSENQIYSKLSEGGQSLLSMFWHEPNKAYDTLIKAQADSNQLFKTIMETSGDRDREVFSAPQNQQWLKQNLAEAVKANASRHEFAYDFHLLTLPWGFDLTKIEAEVHIWHGEQDSVEFHSLNNGIYLDSLLKNAQIHVCENEGWSILWSQTDSILTTICSKSSN